MTLLGLCCNTFLFPFLHISPSVSTGTLLYCIELQTARLGTKDLDATGGALVFLAFTVELAFRFLHPATTNGKWQCRAL